MEEERILEESYTDSTKTSTTSATTIDDRYYDTGWAWVVLLGSFICCFIVNMTLVNYGQFFVEIQTITGCSAERAAWVGTAHFVTYNLLSPLANWLCTKLSYRVVVMTGGVIMTAAKTTAAFVNDVDAFTLTMGLMDGVGAGLVMVPALVFLSHYFKRRFGFATGLTLTSYGLAQFISYKLTSFSLDYLGLHGTLLALASVTAHCLVGGAVFFPRQTRLSTIESTDVDSSILPRENTSIRTQIMHFIPTDPIQFLLMFVYSMVGLCAIAEPKYVPPYSKDLGISGADTAWMFMIAGVPDLIARIGAGAIADVGVVKSRVGPHRLWALTMLVIGATLTAYPLLSEYTPLFVNTMVCSLASSAWVTLAAVACLELVGEDKYAPTFASMCMAMSFMGFMDVLVVGKLRDITGSYRLSFYILSGMAYTSSLATFLLRPLARCRSGYKHLTTEC